MENLSACPLCGGAFEKKLSCVDHTVSRETFSIVVCKSCSFHFTNPRPSASEIGPYYQSADYVSHNDTSSGLINSIYQFVKKRTLKSKLKLIEKYVPRGTKSILDYGCGTGDFLSTCKEAGWAIKGVEPDTGARSRAQNKLGTTSIASELEAVNGFFGIISLWHVLEHVHRLQDTFASLVGKLDKDARLIVAVPNHKSKDANSYGDMWAAYDVPRHLYHFDKTSIANLAAQHSLKLEEVIGMPYDSFYVSMLSEKHKGSGLIGLIKAFFTGLASNFSAMKTHEWSSIIYILKKA